MNLQVTQYSNTLQNARLVPSGILDSTRLSSLLEKLCACANRYGVAPAFADGSGENRLAGDRSAAFAGLGR